MNNQKSTEKLKHQYEKEMEEFRVTMVQTAKRLGFSHPSVLFYSQKIDELHIKLIKLVKSY